MIQGYYYLHVNGDLIYKPMMPDILRDLQESDLVKQYWAFDGEREGARQILTEAKTLGARADRLKELSDKWNVAI